MTWTSEKPTNKIAIIYPFSGEVLKHRVDVVHYWRGQPERLFTFAPNGIRYKWKFDEEPFMVVDPFVADKGVLE